MARTPAAMQDEMKRIRQCVFATTGAKAERSGAAGASARGDMAAVAHWMLAGAELDCIVGFHGSSLALRTT